MANTLQKIVEDLSRETRRTQATDQSSFGRYVISAIDHYSGKRWWFTEAEGTSFNTASGTEYYSIPSNLQKVDSVLVDVNGTFVPMIEKLNEVLENEYVDASNYTGQPFAYALFKNNIRLYPIPDGTYAVKVQGYGTTLPTYSTDASSTWQTSTTSPWANEAYDLIHARSMALIQLYYLRDYDAYQVFSVQEREAFTSLVGENNKRTASGGIKGWGVV